MKSQRAEDEICKNTISTLSNLSR